MRGVISAVSAVALAVGLIGQAGLADAVAGYDSAYAGESAFLSLAPGESGSLTVFFLNTGTTTWTKGAATQVDLAACEDDKLSCDAQDASEAAFNSGWLSATRYATHTQASVPPGMVGTFTYTVKAPADAAAGTYRFNGALVLASSGADIHNEGYFQDVTVAAPVAPATLSSIAPTKGSIKGGTAVTISGSGVACSPTPMVLFGDIQATVTSCTATSVAAKTPAHAAGTVDVTVTNSGAAASNTVTFEFTDDVRPTFDSLAASGQTLTLTFSEPVCVSGGTLAGDTGLSATVNGANVTETGISFADCDDQEHAVIATLMVTESVKAGDTVSVTVTTTGADDVLDAAKNAMDLGKTQTAAAASDSTAPTIRTVTATDEQTLAAAYTEPVKCNSNDPAQFVFDPDTADVANVTARGVTCDGSDTVSVKFATDTFAGGVTGVLKYTPRADPIKDGSGNQAASQSVTIVPTLMDRPTITKATVSRNGFANSADNGDKVTIVFSENMNRTTSGDVVRVQDGDGTIADIKCTGVATADNNILDATCAYSGDTLTMTLLEDPSGETIATGDVAGLQWPATVIDTSNVKDEELKDVDLANSTDKVIDVE